METLHDLFVKAEHLEIHGFELNWDGLEGLFSDVDVEIRKIRGDAYALASFHNKIYVDPNALDVMPSHIFYFMLLHEKGHLESIRKYGLDFHMAMMSSNNYEEYFDHIITEEMIADRYASFCYYQMNGEPYLGRTQELHLPEKREKYHEVVKMSFGMIQNDIDRYNMLIESTLI